MNCFFPKIFIILYLSFFSFNSVLSDVFIVAKVNQEIITNIDLEFEKKYLTSLNPNLKKLDQNRISDYAKNSLINEKIKKIEIEKNFEIVPNEVLLSKVIADIYSSIGLSNLDEFKNYLLQNDMSLEKVKKKITIEIAWNDFIMNNFQNQIEIDKNQIIEDLEKLSEKKVDNLLLSEIIFTIDKKKELVSKYDEIKKSINDIGFEETARIYSLSDSKKSGGNLGWIYKNQLSQEIKDGINEINIGDFTKPIVTSGGILILKLNDIKTENFKVDKDKQLKKMIDFERNRQLTRFSTLHYKRIYNNAEIYEK
tara:strand:+ start:262 stop:1191 length:930 start_codon:yes stop_codon:yes gene_type:complete